MKRGLTESGAVRVDDRGQWDDGRGSWGRICVRAVGGTAGDAQWSLARVAGGDVLTKTTNMIRYAKDAPRVSHILQRRLQPKAMQQTVYVPAPAGTTYLCFPKSPR